MKDNIETFGTRLKETRISRKISQDELAEFLGIRQYSISNYESGKSEPSLEILVKISEKLDVSCDYLLGIDSSNKSKNENLFNNKVNKLNFKQKEQMYTAIIALIEAFESERN